VFCPLKTTGSGETGAQLAGALRSVVDCSVKPVALVGQVKTTFAPAGVAFELVLQKAGTTLPRRDPVDGRIVSDVRNGTGKIINNENEVGGWPAYVSGEPPVDSADDGIPDQWKKTHALPLNEPNVANALNADGYTNLEAYLNSLVVP